MDVFYDIRLINSMFPNEDKPDGMHLHVFWE